MPKYLTRRLSPWMALAIVAPGVAVLASTPVVSSAAAAVAPLLHQPRATDSAAEEWTNLIPGNPNPAVLSLVACPLEGACTATGTEGSATAVETSTGTNAWSSPVVFHPPATTTTPVALSCSDATDCELVLSTTASGKNFAAATTWVANEARGIWGAPVKVNDLPAAKGLDAVTLTGISCPNPSSCVAVGEEQTSATTSTPVEMTMLEGTWQRPTILTAPASEVGCTSLTTCSFVGLSTDAATGQVAVDALDEAAGVDGVVKWLDLGASTVDAQVSPLSCSSAGNCAAAGSTTAFYGSARGDQTGPGFIVTETDGTFRLLRSSDSYTAISCPVDGACRTAGIANRQSYAPAGSSWGAANTSLVEGKTISDVTNQAIASDGVSSALSSISCVSLTSCVAVGTYSNAQNVATGATDTATAALSAPTNVSTTSSDDSVTVAWSAPTAPGFGTISTTATDTVSGRRCTTASTSCTISGLTNGTQATITVAATDAVGHTATAAAVTATPAPLTSLSTSIGTVHLVVGQSLVVPLSTPTLTSGTVTASLGTTVLSSAPISGGAARLTLASLPVGTDHVVVAATTLTNQAAAHLDLVVVVAKATTEVVITLPHTSLRAGVPLTVTIIASVAHPGSGLPTGTVTVTLGAKVIGSGSFVNGRAVLVLRSLPAGRVLLTAHYAGNTNLLGATASQVLSIAA